MTVAYFQSIFHNLIQLLKCNMGQYEISKLLSMLTYKIWAPYQDSVLHYYFLEKLDLLIAYLKSFVVFLCNSFLRVTCCAIYFSTFMHISNSLFVNEIVEFEFTFLRINIPYNAHHLQHLFFHTISLFLHSALGEFQIKLQNLSLRLSQD